MYSSPPGHSIAFQRPPAVDHRASDTIVSQWARLALISLTRHDRASFSTAFSMRNPAEHIRLAKTLKQMEELSRDSTSTNTLNNTISSVLASVTGGSNFQAAGVLDQFFKFLLVWATDKVTLDRVLEEYALFYRDLLTLFMATTPMGPPIWPLVALIHRQMIAISRQVDYARNVPNKASAIDAAWSQVFAILPLGNLPVSLRAAYHAFLGKRAMIVNDDATAEANLTQAIHLTPRRSARNLRILMCQLVTVRLSAGQPPPQHLLNQYQMAAQWTPLLQAMRSCNFPAVEQAIDQNIAFFRAHGVYGALIERPRAVMMRLCARKCINVWRDLFAPTDTQGRSPRIHMCFYAAAFDRMFHDEPWDSPAESFNAAYLRVNNLIARGLLRGFVHPSTGDHFVSKARDINKTVPPLAISVAAAPDMGDEGMSTFASAGGFATGQANGFDGGPMNGFGHAFNGAAVHASGGAFPNAASGASAFPTNTHSAGGLPQQQQQVVPAVPFGTGPSASQPIGGTAPASSSGFMASIPGFGQQHQQQRAVPVPPSGFLASMPGMAGASQGAMQGTSFGGFGASSNGTSGVGSWAQVQQPPQQQQQQQQQQLVFGSDPSAGFGGFSGFTPT